VVYNERIGSQRRPAVTGDVVSCELVGAETVGAIDDASTFIERAGGRFIAKWHRRERCPIS
jgi:hypothetical protein